MSSHMDPTAIDRVLQRIDDNASRMKLHKLLVDRHIPYISSNESFEVLKLLGYGALGRVRLVSYHHRLYAHKSAFRNASKERRNILNEALTLSELADYHPNIQRLYFIDLNSCGFLMDYCSCGSLEGHLRDPEVTYTLTNALEWGYQLADALSFLHARNLMHRDVKVQNILLKDNYRTAVLSDYGTATDLRRSVLTSDIGSVMTMAPEVFMGTKYTEKCDIYGWAIVFFQLLTKQHNPYKEWQHHSAALLFKVCTENYRPRPIQPCPRLLEALMYRAWHKDPNERPSLSFIKAVLRLFTNALPHRQAAYCENAILAEQTKWANVCEASEKHLLTAPRVAHANSVHLYQDCLRKTRSIREVTEILTEMRLKMEQYQQHRDTKKDRVAHLSAENERLRSEIEKLRNKTLS